MSTETQPAAPTSNKMIWAGRIVSALPVLMLVMSAAMKFIQPASMAEDMAKLGFSTNVIFGIGVVEVLCTILYVIPQTAVLGAILLTGYLGGATVTHLRMHESVVFPVLLGMIVWFGLFLRDARIRALIPLRR